MSRIGKKPIVIPKGVKVQQNGNEVKAEGPKGSLSLKLPVDISMAVSEGQVVLSRRDDERRAKSLHGLTRTLVNNMITGVSAGFQKTLEISGVGYRAELAGDLLKFFVGYSRPVEYRVPKGISIKVEKQVTLVVSGIDKQFVGSVAAELRAIRKPEPYKGKGIRYQGERIRRKVGKSAGA
ncbi:MAG: 50S ribosomal protein L6 [Syntrophales bacterium]|nr:50S ribosomal protein L6 [Syntrophales bacterium]MDD5233559.1 50S ribosomal protein L6 [Syntrophales bacterium]MDD5531758.1 50S ribosomal protein L6 [Syntrophales bacterium]HPL63944.1 50S ribosomal protein L6 [Syntrophales bacterium]